MCFIYSVPNFSLYIKNFIDHLFGLPLSSHVNRLETPFFLKDTQLYCLLWSFLSLIGQIEISIRINFYKQIYILYVRVL